MQPSPQFREQVSAKLIDSGITPTRQRMQIGLCLFGKDQHLTADQLLKRVKTDFGDVSKATVYNTLGLFAEKNLVREVVVNPSNVVYDTNTSRHHHIFNIDTGELRDIETNRIQLTKMPELDEATEIDGVEVIVRVRNK